MYRQDRPVSGLSASTWSTTSSPKVLALNRSASSKPWSPRHSKCSTYFAMEQTGLQHASFINVLVCRTKSKCQQQMSAVLGSCSSPNTFLAQAHSACIHTTLDSRVLYQIWPLMVILQPSTALARSPRLPHSNRANGSRLQPVPPVKGWLLQSIRLEESLLCCRRDVQQASWLPRCQAMGSS